MLSQTKARATVDPETQTVIKVTTSKLEIAAALLEQHKKKYETATHSRIMISSESQLFFVFLNVENEELLEKLNLVEELR